MNKQELIERMKGFKKIFNNKVEYIELDTATELISRLDEPQKPVVPEIVNAYIQDARECDWDIEDLFNSMKSEENQELLKWFYHECNQETLARAWLDGYEVKKEKRYRVKMKGMDKEFTMLKLDEIRGSWFLGSVTEYSYTKTTHTRKELEEAGFGWVFDCPGVEIEEVQDDTKV